VEEWFVVVMDYMQVMKMLSIKLLVMHFFIYHGADLQMKCCIVIRHFKSFHCIDVQ